MLISSHRLPLSRRELLGGGMAALATASAAAAPLVVELNPSGTFRPISIAITPLQGGAAAGQLTGVITNNMSQSIFLAPLDPASFPESITNPATAPDMGKWRQAGVQYVVTGSAEGGGTLNVQFRMWDVNSAQQVVGKQFSGGASALRRIGHKIADAIFERATGRGGFFDSRVAFVDGTGPATRRVKRIAIMDEDGANVRYLTRGDDLAVTPRFSPNAHEIAYMSFGVGHPKVTMLNVDSGRRETLGNFPGMTFSPRFSPDGRSVLMSLSQGTASNIYLYQRGSRQTVQLTNSQSINASPCYSPDGSKIVFESDRGGNQQIYVMAASGGDANRISFGEGRYSTPVWSPKGDLIAFTKQHGGEFAIGVMKPDGSGEKILTQGFHNEGPTWAPNGLFVMFFRDPGGNAGSHILMSDIFGHGIVKVPTPHFASDPTWGPLRA